MTDNDFDDEHIPTEYRELFKKIKKIEQALGLSEIEKHIEDLNRSLIAENDLGTEEEISEEEITKSILQTEKQFEIIVNTKAYFKLAKHALSYANPSISPEKWVEVIGLLTGYITAEDTPLEQIIVEDYWPVAEGNAVSVEIGNHNVFTEILQKKEPNHFIIGWAHSHPSYSPFLSNDDYQTHLRYQTFWKKSIALVIDPLMITEDDYGYEVFRIDQLKQSYYNLFIEVDGMDTARCFKTIKDIMKE